MESFSTTVDPPAALGTVAERERTASGGTCVISSCQACYTDEPC